MISKRACLLAFFVLLPFFLGGLDISDYSNRFRATWPGLVEIVLKGTKDSILLPREFLGDELSGISSDKIEIDRDTRSRILVTLRNPKRNYGVFVPANDGDFAELTAMRLSLKSDDGGDVSILDVPQGNLICFAPNGNLYTVSSFSWSNDSIFLYRKYQYIQTTWLEQPQALLYVGDQTTLNAECDVYSNEDFSMKIGTLAKDSSVLVVGVKYKLSHDFLESNENRVLVVGASGICGWILDKAIGTREPYTGMKNITNFHVLNIMNGVRPALP